MPEIRFTEEDHAFAQEFVDRLESSGVAGTVREFLSKDRDVQKKTRSGGGFIAEWD